MIGRAGATPPGTYMAAEERRIRTYSDMHTYYAEEDGVRRKGIRQNLDPVFKHVRKMDDKMNGAPQRGNSGWSYRGSIPMSVLVDWLGKNHYSMDQWARNEDGAKDKFIKHVTSREYHKLFAHNQRLN